MFAASLHHPPRASVSHCEMKPPPKSLPAAWEAGGWVGEDLRLGNRGGIKVWTTLMDPAAVSLSSVGEEGM